MQVNLYATFRLLAKVKSFELEVLDGASAMNAIEKIVALFPVLRPHWLNDAGELHAHVHMFINGHEVLTLPQGLDTRLHTHDTLDFFPPVAGG
jgi:molybdopterin synthase sulfur carrier subunit